MDREKLMTGIFLGALCICLVWAIYCIGTMECIKSHTEKQMVMPTGIVVGGSRYGGGVSIPIGNEREVEVEVCDQYK